MLYLIGEFLRITNIQCYVVLLTIKQNYNNLLRYLNTRVCYLKATSFQNGFFRFEFTLMVYIILQLVPKIFMSTQMLSN